MITVTAPEKASSALRVSASPASRVVMYEFRHIDIVCTRASNISTSKSTHTGAILHTRCLTYGMGRVCKNREYIFDIKKKGEKSFLLLSCATRRSYW